MCKITAEIDCEEIIIVLSLKDKKIFVFHINNSKDLPLDSLKDSDRLWPGDSIISLNKILSSLKKIEFDRATTVELFNPEY
jgi:2-keto-myo-inositol isomerase